MSLKNATAPLLAGAQSCEGVPSNAVQTPGVAAGQCIRKEITAPATEGALAYDPNRLLDTVAQRLGISGDRMLSRMLQLSLQIVRGMRAGRLPVRASILLAIAECIGASVEELRHILGDRRSKARMTCGTLAA